MTARGVRLVVTTAVLAAAMVVALPTPARAGSSPIGHFDDIWYGGPGRPHTVTVVGWAFDPDAPDESIRIDLYTAGQGTGTPRTRFPREDVVAVHPAAGPATGFLAATYLPISRGTDMCAYAIDVTGDENTLLGCMDLFPTNHTGTEPVGSLDSVTSTPGLAAIRGWAVDEVDAGAVEVVVDGHMWFVSPPNALRPDVPAAFPSFPTMPASNSRFPSQRDDTRSACGA